MDVDDWQAVTTTHGTKPLKTRGIADARQKRLKKIVES
jgi:hypothetical protein